MSADDLNAPLGQHVKKRRLALPKLPFNTSQALAGALALFLGVFVLWAVVGSNPFGGEPMVDVRINAKPADKTTEGQRPPEVFAGTPNRYDGPSATQPQAGQPAQPPAANSKTVTIIDGKTGQRQDVEIPAATGEAVSPAAIPVDQKYVDMTAHGAVPKIAADGVRPADAFAQPVKALPGKPDAPRIAIIVGGLGISESATANAIKLPGPVTLGFMPYGNDVVALAARARDQGHEVLLQLPMEPFDYPDNDPGPQTLLTSLAPQQNIERLYWLMSRFQGYVGVASAMGARFTASEQAFAPVMHEVAKRGLIYVDDGANPRSLAGRIAGADNLPFARAEMLIDSVPTPVEIDNALGRLEMSAREHGVAVGMASALPVSIDHIAKWAKGLEGRGLILVPITAVALKTKQS